MLRELIHGQVELLTQRGYRKVVIEPYDHRAFGEGALLVYFEPTGEVLEAEAQQLLRILIPSLATSSIRFVAFVDSRERRYRQGMPEFDCAFWRIGRDGWLAIGDDPYEYFESRLEETPPSQENVLRRAQYQLRMALMDRAGSRWARARALLRSGLAEVSPARGGRRTELAILEALLGDAVMNRDDPLNTDAERDAWFQRYVAVKSELNETLGTGPIYLVARRFRPCGNHFTMVDFDILPDGRVVNATAVDVDDEKRLSGVCKRELLAAITRWRYAPHVGPQPKHRHQVFHTFEQRRDTLESAGIQPALPD